MLVLKFNSIIYLSNRVVGNQAVIAAIDLLGASFLLMVPAFSAFIGEVNMLKDLA